MSEIYDVAIIGGGPAGSTAGCLLPSPDAPSRTSRLPHSFSDCHDMRSLILASALALTLLFTGCQTPKSFPTPDSTWKAHVGQLKFSNRKRTLIGDVVVQQRGRDEFQLDFIKGGGLPLISVRQDAATSRAEGILVHGSWQGAPGSAPHALRPWLKLRESFAPSGSKKANTEAQYSGGQLSMLFVAFPDEDQRFVFQFSR
ncbi:MAG: hypothetical protein WDN28_06935 [Chthoniobacter sp.]